MLYNKERFEVYEIPFVLECPLREKLKVAELIAVRTESEQLVAILPELNREIVI